MITITDIDGRNRLLDANLFCELVEIGWKAGEAALYESIAAATPDELAPFLQQRHANGRTPLLLAASLGHVGLARLLVQKGADHKARDGDYGTTLLMIAASDSIEVLQYFLQELDCTDLVNAQDNIGQTALHLAILENPPAVELLLKHGADPNIRAKSDVTPLYWAARKGNAESAAVLWKYGASVHDVDNNRTTVLMVAAHYSIEVLQYFLRELHCSDIINAQDHDGGTALHWGVHNSTEGIEGLTVVELLLKHGADPNVRNKRQETPLHSAACKGNILPARSLVEYGADLSLIDHHKRNAMHFAARNTHMQFVHWLLEIGPEDLMFAKDQFGRTPLDEASQQKDSHDIMDLLLDNYHQKILEQENFLCFHWLLRAAIYEEGEFTLPVGTLTVDWMVIFFTKFKPEERNLVSRCDDTGALPLHIACQYTETPMQLIEFLVEQDPATVRRTDHAGKLPIHVACQYTKTPIQLIEFLVKQDPFIVRRTDHAGNLPIHRLCASRPSLQEVTYLLSQDAESITTLNNQGRSPFEAASLASASVEVIWYLMKIDPGVALAGLCRSSTRKRGYHIDSRLSLNNRTDSKLPRVSS